MWNRKQLKERGKRSFQRNYWKSVLVALLFLVFAGGVASVAGSSENSGAAEQAQTTGQASFHLELGDFYEDTYPLDGDVTDGMFTLAVVIVVTLVVLLLVFAVFIALDVLICNPIALGCNRFFLQNLREPAQVKEVAYGFDNGYRNIVKVLFFRDLYTFLWSLLLIVPGIVKAYEYRMIPYLLAEQPEMTKEQAFAESRRMMDGQKWRAFVLDLSFLGWHLLSVLTLGILEIFYVAPYVNATDAALYEALRYENPAPQGKSSENRQRNQAAYAATAS